MQHIYVQFCFDLQINVLLIKKGSKNQQRNGHEMCFKWKHTETQIPINEYISITNFKVNKKQKQSK